MRRNLVWQLTMIFILMVGCTAGLSTKSGEKPSLLHLRVDFAPPSSEQDMTPIPGTEKQGWFHWVIPGLWDFYRADMTWEDGSRKLPKDGPGISGSGVHASITNHYEGIMGIGVAGMRRYLAGGIQPEKKPIYDPICNSWISGTDFPYKPSSDLLLSLYGLGAGKYRLVSYHNSFNCRRIGDDPTGVECSETKEPEPPMPSIKVYPLKTINAEYYKKVAGDSNRKGFDNSPGMTIAPGTAGTGNVKQTLEAKNVVIQQVKTDAKLKPSIIEFTTDGSPLVVVYAGGCCKSDDLRRHRKGGYAVLNAFELIQLPAATTQGR